MNTAGKNDTLQGVVFDFDGTLAELTLDFDRMRNMAQEAGRRLFPHLPGPDGQPVLEWAAKTSKSLPSTDAERFLHAVEQAVQAVEMQAAAEGKLFDHTLDVLQELRANNTAVGLITRNCTAAVELAFPDWERSALCLLARDYGGPVKPDPAHLIRALEMIGAPPKRSLMVGDHPIDIQVGKAAGALTAGVASGRMSQIDLKAAGADMTAAHCGELLVLLRQEGLL